MRRLVEAVGDVGITYRQADYWVSSGYIDAPMKSQHGDEPADNPGSGHVRVITWGEEAVLMVMADLVKSGIQAKRAAKMARSLAVDGGPLPLGRSLRLSLTSEVAS